MEGGVSEVLTTGMVYRMVGSGVGVVYWWPDCIPVEGMANVHATSGHNHGIGNRLLCVAMCCCVATGFTPATSGVAE